MRVRSIGKLFIALGVVGIIIGLIGSFFLYATVGQITVGSEITSEPFQITGV